MGKPKWSNGGFGKSDIEGKAAMVAARELGSERVSNGAGAHESKLGSKRVSIARVDGNAARVAGASMGPCE
jgi:hypothetical protein